MALTSNLAPQCRAFSRALQNEKLKARLFPGPVGAEDTNDWCIKLQRSSLSTIIFLSTFERVID